MKIRKYTYIYTTALLFFFLLGGKQAFAAISSETVTGTDSDGNRMNFRYQSYTAENPLSVEEMSTGYYRSVYEITENVDFILVQGKYYTGYATAGIAISPSLSNTKLSAVWIESVNSTEGLHVYISSTNDSRTNVNFVFDNYYTSTETVIGAATVHFRFIRDDTNSSGYGACNFTPTITLSRTLHGYEGVQNNALTGMIYSSIEQATQQDFDDIINILTAMRNQDPVYYQQIIDALDLLDYDQRMIYSQVTGILNSTHADFQAVQTVLDLFPSYRTQVLQYWQQLLEMNAAQSSAAADMESEYADKDQISSGIISDLGSVSMPSFNAVDFDVMANVDQSSKSNFFGLVATITHNGFITTILLTVITAAIAGFVLYGKRS